MDADQYRRVEDLFHAASQLPRDEREGFLDRACGADIQIRREVESLLAVSVDRPSFLAGASGPPGAIDLTPAEPDDDASRLPLQIGPYRLVREIGRGGMGRVYLADQETESFRRTVAVKLLSHGGALTTRFRAEQQILAGLEHPGIARLYDAGVTPDGRSFLVLELVEGEDLVAYCQGRRLPLIDRLRLFAQVCTAVQYAHQQLVVHRDLKPANILVTRTGEPKLLDFGIAKLLQPDAEGAVETIAGLRPMTPAYASPEQVAGGRVSPATDVYSLGVILFELLTGERPYRVRTGSPEEISRSVIDQVPKRPSAVAASRGTEAPVEPRRLRGDLDTIVLKALEKDAARRYPTASELADDLRRFLAGLPVLARPDALSYRTGKFVRRHLAAVTTGMVVVLSLAGGLAFALWQARVASAERDRAQAEAARADETATFLAELFSTADPARTRGERLTVREVLDRGAARVARDLAGQPELQASLLTLIGAVYRDLSVFDSARSALERAVALARDNPARVPPSALARALTELAALERVAGSLEAGRRQAEEALGIQDAANQTGGLERARTLSALATIDRMQGNPAAGRERLDRALAIAVEQGFETAESARWLSNRGLMHFDGGSLDAALADFRAALSSLERVDGPDSPLLALVLDNLGMTLRAIGRFDEALSSLERALALTERSWGRNHFQYGTALNSLGMTHLEMGRYEEARRLFREAASVYEATAGTHSTAVVWPVTNEGLALLELGRPAEALSRFRRALAIREKLFGTDHWQVASSHSDVGLALAAMGDRAGAEVELRRGLAIGRRVLSPPTTTLAEQMTYLAKLLSETGRPVEARALYTEALSIFREQFPADHPSTRQCVAALARLGG